MEAHQAAEAVSRKEIDQLQKVFARAEAQAQASHAEVQRLTQLCASAEAEAKRSAQAHQVAEATNRKVIDQLQQQVGKWEASDGALQRELQKAQQEAERALENERRARDEAAELRGQLKALTEKGTK